MNAGTMEPITLQFTPEYMRRLREAAQVSGKSIEQILTEMITWDRLTEMINGKFIDVTLSPENQETLAEVIRITGKERDEILDEVLTVNRRDHLLEQMEAEILFTRCDFVEKLEQLIFSSQKPAVADFLKMLR